MRSLIAIAFFLCFLSCKDTPTSSTAIVNGSEVLTSAADAYNKNKSISTAGNYLKVILSELGNQEITQADRKTLLLTGLKVAGDNGLDSKKLGFLYPLVRSFDSDPENDDRLLDMANVMKSINKNDGANVIYHNLASKGKKYESVKSKMSTEIPDLDAYVKALGEKIFENPDFNGVNKLASQNYVDACESFALSAGNNPEAAGYLFKAAEIARTIRTFPKVMSLYDWIGEKYPNYEKAPTVMFLKGFVIENDLKNIEKAKEVYNQFLQKYPSHELADDVKFLLEHIGKSDEEILKIIESKKSNPQ